jgi:hypothetical protein
MIVAVLTVVPLLGCGPSPSGQSAAQVPGAGTTSNAPTERGLSMADAIQLDARTEIEGVEAEYKYIARTYPGWRVESQSLIHEGDRSYDLLEIADSTGRKKAIYFDITNWFGKLQ